MDATIDKLRLSEIPKILNELPMFRCIEYKELIHDDWDNVYISRSLCVDDSMNGEMYSSIYHLIDGKVLGLPYLQNKNHIFKASYSDHYYKDMEKRKLIDVFDGNEEMATNIICLMANDEMKSVAEQTINGLWDCDHLSLYDFNFKSDLGEKCIVRILQQYKEHFLEFDGDVWFTCDDGKACPIDEIMIKIDEVNIILKLDISAYHIKSNNKAKRI